jgi:hypothetical protein
MTYSYTTSESTTFTLTHAKHLASKVATDLKRIQRLYQRPSDSDIDAYEIELIELLKAGYLGTLTVGFKRNDKWIEPTLRYTARDLVGLVTNDDDPGRIRSNANIDGALFCNHLTHSAAWYNLTLAEQEAFQQRLPFNRTTSPESGINGYFANDRSYSAGGLALERSSVRSY